jgi:hypothetical protein
MTHGIERDQFVSDEFIDKNATLPTVIVLNDQLHCGYFIPVSTMAKCGWIDFDESQLITHTFRSGEMEQGVLINNPRMLVCPKTELYQYDVEASEQQRKRAIVGLYDAALKDDKNIKTERLYLVFFLDENNNPLHSLPLKYAARGVNGATFEVERRAFKAQLETCHALTNQVPAKPKNDLFHALGVFCFTTQAELGGEKQNKSWCCRVVSHEVPTTETWKNYFVGYSQLKDYTWSALEPGQKIDVLSIPALEAEAQAVEALSPGDELDSFKHHYGRGAKSENRKFAQPMVTASIPDADVGF